MQLDDYVGGPFRSIEGWCEPAIWDLVAVITAFHEENGVVGPAAEIGVHHGRFFIGLVLATGTREGNLAIDVFGDQGANLDRSGSGDRTHFVRNLDACGIELGKVDIREADSTTLTPADIGVVPRFALFSVDGSHRVEHTINDIELAMAVTHPAGIIFVDDYLHPEWPGVGEAVARLYHFGAPRFVPVAYAANKLLLCHIRYHAGYLKVFAGLRRIRPKPHIKQVPRFGYETLAITPNAIESAPDASSAEP